MIRSADGNRDIESWKREEDKSSKDLRRNLASSPPWTADDVGTLKRGDDGGGKGKGEEEFSTRPVQKQDLHLGRRTWRRLRYTHPVMSPESQKTVGEIVGREIFEKKQNLFICSFVALSFPIFLSFYPSALFLKGFLPFFTTGCASASQLDCLSIRLSVFMSRSPFVGCSVGWYASCK